MYMLCMDNLFSFDFFAIIIFSAIEHVHTLWQLCFYIRATFNHIIWVILVEWRQSMLTWRHVTNGRWNQQSFKKNPEHKTNATSALLNCLAFCSQFSFDKGVSHTNIFHDLCLLPFRCTHCWLCRFSDRLTKNERGLFNETKTCVEPSQILRYWHVSWYTNVFKIYNICSYIARCFAKP